MTVKAIFWDNDGVLVDTEGLYFQANREILRQIGIDLSMDHFLELSLNQGVSVIRLAADAGYNEADLSDLKKRRDDHYLNLLKNGICVMDGAEDVLKTLYGRMKMGIVTSSQRIHFDVIHKQTGFLKYFDFILTREDYQNTKPDPEPYLKALELSGCRPDQCLIIEDTLRGLDAAKAAGIPCIVKPNNFAGDQLFEGAKTVIHSLREIAAMIESTTTK